MQSIARIKDRVDKLLAARAPRPHPHSGLLVRFVASDGSGGPAPLPPDAPPIRKPERRDPRDGIDIVLVDENGREFQPRCA
jgi:hypothetical protein